MKTLEELKKEKGTLVVAHRGSSAREHPMQYHGCI